MPTFTNTPTFNKEMLLQRLDEDLTAYGSRKEFRLTERPLPSEAKHKKEPALPAAGRIECFHSPHKHQHGTSAAYDQDFCRCYSCKKAHRKDRARG